MLRNLICISLFACLASAGCKAKEKKAEQTPTKAEPAAAKPVDKMPENLPAVEPDLAAIDTALQRLGDATLALAKNKGLPNFTGDLGISCGNDHEVLDLLLAMSIPASSLATGKGFLFQDVCVGWRPYISPATEMYWMISAGTPAEGEDLMPARRCLQVVQTEGVFQKAEIMDGPCLTMHRQN